MSETNVTSQRHTGNAAWLIPLETAAGLRRGELKVLDPARDQFIVGSVRGCDVLVPDPTVAPRHARITLDPQGTCFSIEGLGTSAQTALWRDGAFAPVTGTCRLADGDRVRIGEVPFLFRSIY